MKNKKKDQGVSNVQPAYLPMYISRPSVDQLLLAVVRGEQDKAEKILQSYPEFLLDNTGSVTVRPRRTIVNLTPFQAALCMGNLAMWKMMRVYFNKLENGQDELNKQFNEIVPEKEAISQVRAKKGS